MRSPTATAFTTGALLALLTLPVAAQPPTGVLADLLKDVDEVEQKLVGLANAIPDANYGWRPAPGVRSVGEVFKHVAADNYFLPALLGTAAPASTGIKGDSYESVQAYENRQADRAAIIAELQASFAHLKQAMRATPADRMSRETDFFGTKHTLQQVWILTTTHLHEHLGQMIAYARSNGVVPPWSRGG
jgi:uncharacterized damage-inducible protein DinB